MTPFKVTWGARPVLAMLFSYLAVGLSVGFLFPDVGPRASLAPGGIAMAMVLAAGYSASFLVFLGAVSLNLILGIVPGVAFAAAGATTFETLVGAALVNRFAGGQRFLETPRDFRMFCLLGGVASTLITPVFNLAGPPAAVSLLPEDLKAWLGSRLAETGSLLVLAPLALTWNTRPRPQWTRRELVELAALFGLLVPVAAAVFECWDTGETARFLRYYLCWPFLVWVAFRFSLREAATVVSALALIGIWGLARRREFSVENGPGPELFEYLEFVIISAIVALTITIVVAQRRQTRLALQAALADTESQIQERTRTLKLEVAQRLEAERALQVSHTDLELRVRERTAALSQSNAALQFEIRQRKQAEAERLQALARLVDVQENERTRISRELHDQLGQDLTALKLRLRVLLEPALDASTARQQFENLDATADGLMRKTHHIAWDLRPPALDDFGVEPVLRHFVEEWSERAAVRADYHARGMAGPRLPLRLENALYRVAQEALTNVLRHARARRVSVLLERTHSQVSLIVEDDGQGFEADAAQRHSGERGRLGLLGMQERVKLVGGDLTLESSPGNGTTVIVRIPLIIPGGEQEPEP